MRMKEESEKALKKKERKKERKRERKNERTKERKKERKLRSWHLVPSLHDKLNGRKWK